VNTAESTIILALDMATQRRLVDQVRAVIKAAPLVQPLAVGGQPMSVRITNAGDHGWVADGRSYRYADKDSRGYPWPRIPGDWIEIADQAVAADPRHDGSPTRWDAAIINWYPPGASLGPHVDDTEEDLTHPVVTVSLGDGATWGVEVEERWTDELGRAVIGWDRSRAHLPSGSVTVLAGPLRMASHTIIGLVAAPMFSPIVDKDGAYVPGRIAVSMRAAGRRRNR
jgi:alkylated DNA repair protein (DNA oxidative demethylase)